MFPGLSHRSARSLAAASPPPGPRVASRTASPTRLCTAASIVAPSVSAQSRASVRTRSSASVIRFPLPEQGTRDGLAHGARCCYVGVMAGVWVAVHQVRAGRAEAGELGQQADPAHVPGAERMITVPVGPLVATIIGWLGMLAVARSEIPRPDFMQPQYRVQRIGGAVRLAGPPVGPRVGAPRNADPRSGVARAHVLPVIVLDPLQGSGQRV